VTAQATDPPARAVVELGLGLGWQVDDDPYGLGLDGLLGLALRDNPKRAQLVVSRVLGKHLPVDPAAARLAGDSLAALIDADAPLVLGFCETATGLGHVVAQALTGAHYVHTTRRPDPTVPVLAGFDEEHSHAVAHTLQLRRPAELADPRRTVVLVDDELTTGTTALNTVAALHALHPHDRYVVATLLDLRPPAVRAAFAARAAAMGVAVDMVSLLAGSLDVPPDVARRAGLLRARLAEVAPATLPPGPGGRVVELTGTWPRGVPVGGRTGVAAGALDAHVTELAAQVTPQLSGGPLLVLGTEELMWLPLQLAEALAPACSSVRYHSTTRSPVLAANLPGYAVRRALLFPAPDEPGRTSRLHGLPDEPYADVVVVVDAPHAAARPLAQALRPWASASVVVVTV